MRRGAVEAPLPLLIAVGAATLLVVAATDGSVAAAAAPVLAVAFVYAAIRAPLRTCVAGLMFLALIADSPQDHPMAGFWRSPLFALGQVLCSNWSDTFGLSFLPVSGMDVLCLLLLARTAFEQRRPSRAARPFSLALAAFAGTLVALGAFGLARGGSLDSAYWQVRQLAFIPAFAWLLASCLGPGDHRLLGRIVLAAAAIKASIGLYFELAIALPRGLHPPFITTHADTLLFCLAISLVALRWLEEPARASFLRCLWVLPLLLTAVWLNNRRVAWVGLAASFLVVWQHTRWNPGKRALARLGLVLAPLLCVYLAAGWSSKAAAFKPVAAIRTLVATRDGTRAVDPSTRAREIENYNLAQTMRLHPLGIGLGHGYDEVVKGPDISSDFALYRYIPHNSVLWLLTAGGPLGFFLLWSLFAVGLFLAARSHRFSRSPLDRVAALGALLAQLLFLLQAWGDMGTQNWSTTWLVAAGLAVSARLAVSTGAWPARLLPEPAAPPAFPSSLEPAWTPPF